MSELVITVDVSPGLHGACPIVVDGDPVGRLTCYTDEFGMVVPENVLFARGVLAGLDSVKQFGRCLACYDQFGRLLATIVTRESEWLKGGVLCRKDSPALSAYVQLPADPAPAHQFGGAA